MKEKLCNTILQMFSCEDGRMMWKMNEVDAIIFPLKLKRKLIMTPSLLLRLVQTRHVGILHCAGDLGPQIFLASFSSPQGSEKVLEIIMSRCSPHESLSSVEDNAGKIFIFRRSEMVESLVDTLIIHLVTFLRQARKVGMVPDLLDHRVDLVLRQG